MGGARRTSARGSGRGTAARAPVPERGRGARQAPARKTATRRAEDERTAARRATTSRARTAPAQERRDTRGAPSRGTARARQASRTQAARKSARRGVKSRTALANRSAYFVFIPTMLLLLLGLVMVFSAGSIYGLNQGGYRYFVQQAGWAALGFGLMIFLSLVDYHKLGRLSLAGVVISIGLLLAVLIFGKTVGGATRWIVVGPLNLQPTEIAKFATVVFAAYALSTKGDRVKSLVQLVVPVLVIAVLEAALILKQPDLGSAIVLFSSVLVVMAVSKSRVAHLALIGGIGATAGVVAMVSAPYRRARVFSFLNPWKSPQGYGYHVIQSYIALGSGHVKGLGLGMSRQKFLYLPNAHNDFIFAIIGEELGLIGTLIVVTLVAFLAIGGIAIARRSPDELGRLLAVGIIGLIVIQALVNMAGVTGLLPITGVPLPLVSFGGSSLCICMACIGILLNIASQSR